MRLRHDAIIANALRVGHHLLARREGPSGR
jgi:hypothetical protein